MAFQYDEFNDASIAAVWTQGGNGTLIEQNNKLIYRATGAWPASGSTVSQPYQTEFDIWWKVEGTGKEGVDYSGQNVYLYIDDPGFTGYVQLGLTYNNAGGCGAPYADTWAVHAEIDDEGVPDWETICVAIDQDNVWLRLRKELSGVWQFFYSLREPLEDGEWIEMVMTKGLTWEPTNSNPLSFEGRYFTLTGYPKDTYLHFVRGWQSLPAVPPSLDQYQRLQGYPKVTHPLVFNRNTGAFEVMEQARPAAPLPIVEGADVLAYDGSGNLSTITRTIKGITYVKTLTYTAGNLTGVTVWVEQ